MPNHVNTREELLKEIEMLQLRLVETDRKYNIEMQQLEAEHKYIRAELLQRVRALEVKLGNGYDTVSSSLSDSAENVSDDWQLLTMVKSQAEELEKFYEKLNIQTEELKAANEELAVQSEELRIQNEELIAQTEFLEAQKTEMEHLSRELETEKALLESVLEQMPASVVIAVAPAGPLLLSNQVANQMWGKSLQGLPNLEAFWRIPRYHRDGRAYRKEEMPLWRSLTLGEVVLDEEYSLRPQGRPPIYLSVRSAPVRDENGRIVAGVITHFDISERKRAEVAVRESQEDLNRAQAVAHIGSWRLEVQRDVLTWSDETYRIFQIPQGTPLTYEMFLAHVHPEDRGYVNQMWTAALGGEPYDIEHRILAGDEVKWVRERAELEFDSKGQLLGGFGTVQDITERKLAQETLLRNKQQMELLAETASQLLASGSLQQIVDSLCHKVMDFLGCDVFFNFLVDENADRLHLNAYAGIPAEEAKKLEWLDFGVAVCGCAAQEGCRMVTEEIQTTPDPRTELIKSYGIQAYACHPLFLQGRVLGTLSFGTRTRSHFTSDDLALMKAVADQVAVAMDRKLAEESMVRAKEEWERTFDAVPDSIALLDKDHRVTRINRAMAELLEKTPEEVVGKPCYEVVHNLGGAPGYCPHSQMVSTGQDCTAEVHELGRVFAITVSPTFDPSGQLLGGVHVARDITASKEMEEALKRSHEELELRIKERTTELRDTVAQLIEEVQERQRAEESLRKQAELLDLAQESIIVRELDSRIIFWNRGAEETYGWSREQAMGRGSNALLKTRFPSSPEEVEQELLRAGMWYGELVHTRADGEEIVIASRQVMQRNDEGVPVAILEVNRDITARRRAEEALKNERQRLFSVLERIPAHVSLLRPDYTFAYVNGEFIRRFGEPGAKRCYELLGLQNPCTECQAMGAFHTHQPVVWEWTGPDNNTYQLYDYPFMDVDGSPLVLEMGVDITPRKRADEALKAERQRFYGVLERIPAYVVLISPKCTIPYANREFIKRFGDPGNKACHEYLFELNAPCEDCKALEVLKTGTPALWEWAGPDKNTYQVYDYPFTDIDGSPLILEMGVDVTSRKKAEENTKSLERMYRMMSKVNEAIVRFSDREELFRQICRIMKKEGEFLLAWIGMVEPETRLVRAATDYDLNDPYVQNITIPLNDVPEGRGPTGIAAREGRSDVCNDIAADPRMAPWREQALIRGFRSSAAFPLRVGSDVVGVLTVYANKPDYFSAEEIRLLESLGDDLSFALEFQARDAQRRVMEEVLRESEERLRHLTLQLLHAQEKERRHLALELHDDLGQSLMVLKMQLRTIERTVPLDQLRAKEECSNCLDYLNGVIDNVRRLARNLRPSVLDDLGFSAGLRVLMEEFRKYHEVELSLEMDNIEDLFSQAEEVNLYRIFQETLNNIAKHAKAKHIRIVIRRQTDGVLFTVADDGVGFDLRQVLARDASKKGLGLAALEERVRILGSSLTIKAQENLGTEVSFLVPRTMEATIE